MVLTEPDAVPDATAELLSALDPSRVVVIGGAGAVSDAVAQQVVDLTGATVERLAGISRHATVAAVATAAWPDGADTVLVATGEDFPDALGGAAAAASRDAPVLLANRTVLPLAVSDLLGDLLNP